MKADVDDWLVVKGATTGRGERRGLIAEVHSADGAKPYVVRWLDDGHEATVFPGPDAVVGTPDEQPSADQRAMLRVDAVQLSIRDDATVRRGEQGRSR